jgi:hypothetical protein
MVAAGQIRVPLALVAEENDRSVRKAGDNSMRSSAAARSATCRVTRRMRTYTHSRFSS